MTNQFYNNEEKDELIKDMDTLLDLLVKDITNAMSVSGEFKKSAIYTYIIKYTYPKDKYPKDPKDEVEMFDISIGRICCRKFEKDSITDVSQKFACEHVIPKLMCLFDHVKSIHPRKKHIFMKYNNRKSELEILNKIRPRSLFSKIYFKN